MRALPLLLLLTACGTEAPSEMRASVRDAVPALAADSLAGTFEGHFQVGMEHAGFVPCADTSEVWWAQAAILTTRTASGEVRRTVSSAGNVEARYGETVGAIDDIRGPTVWTRLRGRVSARGARPSYGHDGQYDRALVVDSVEALVADTTLARCPAPRRFLP